MSKNDEELKPMFSYKLQIQEENVKRNLNVILQKQLVRKQSDWN